MQTIPGATVAFCAAANAILIGYALARLVRTRSSATKSWALYAWGCGLGLLLMALEFGTSSPDLRRTLLLIQGATILLIAPVLVIATSLSLQLKIRLSLCGWLYAPLVAYVVGGLLDFWQPYRLLIYQQMLFTAIAAAVFILRKGDRTHHRLAYRMLMVMFAIHVLQIGRIAAGPHARLLVPVGAFVVLGFVAILPWQEAALDAPTVRRRAMKLTQPAELAELREFIEGSRCFTNPELSLESFARLLGRPAYEVSRLINAGEEGSFSDFVNFYRIEYAKVRLMDPESLTLTVDAIASESGFGSRSAFYAAFRRRTGETPTSYRRRHLTS